MPDARYEPVKNRDMHVKAAVVVGGAIGVTKVFYWVLFEWSW